MAKLLNQKEFSILRGCSQQYVSKLVRSGVLNDALHPGPGGRKLIDPIKAEKLLEQHFGPQKGPPSAPGPGPGKKKPTTTAQQQATIEAAGLNTTMTMAEAQRQKAIFEAALKKLDLEERQGKLVDVDQVSKDFFEIARRTRDAILSIPDRIAARAAASPDIHVVRELITNELVQALNELADSKHLD